MLVQVAFKAMASENEVQLHASDRATGERIATLAADEVRRIEAKYSRYRDDSVTTAINRAAGGDWIEIDAETDALLDYAATCHALSRGLFDVTSGVLRRVWDFGRAVVPAPADLKPVLACIGWRHVERAPGRVRLARAGMEIDFGGIGKEYAADRAAAVCLDAGAISGLVNLGGDIRVLGPQPDGAPWIIGVRHPRSAGATIASIALETGALCTSGDYERYFEKDGRRYCHILDPKSGMPVRHWQSVTVIAPLAVAAGSCTTIAMLLAGRARRFLEEQDVPWLAIGPDGRGHGPLATADAAPVGTPPHASC
jgi:thiamine biosynthesis lipoprotein